MAEQKTHQDDNKKRMLIALAILLGFIKNKEEWPDLKPSLKAEVTREFKERNLRVVTDNPERIDERTMQIKIAEQGISDKAKAFKIVGVKDGSTCPNCAKWQGQIVTTYPNNQGLPTVDDFINDHGFHINCRCSLQELDVVEIPRKPPNPRAYNTCFNGYEQNLVFS